jgi:tetratricopeptide (TPR) repeat protein
MNALTYLYWRQGREDEARALNEQAVEQARHGLGDENAETLTALNLKGNLMAEVAGREEEYLTLRKYVLDQRRRILGEEHVDTLSSMHNLALLYVGMGRTNEAVNLLEQTDAIQRRMLGGEHPSSLLTKSLLASVYSQLGYSQRAVTLQGRVLVSCRRVVGDEHLRTITAMQSLASSYADLDRFVEAHALLEERLGTSLRVFGEQSSYTAGGFSDYARVLLTSGPEERRNQNAEEGLRLAERACTLEGVGCGDRPAFLHTLALGQHLNGATENAIETQERSLALTPKESSLRWESEGRLATYYRSAGRAEDAARMARQRLENLRGLIERGGETPKVLNAYARDLLTIEAPDLRDPAAALPLSERACALAEERETYGRWNYLDTLAMAQHTTGDTANAIETQRRALDLLPPDYHLLRKEMEQRLGEYEAALATSDPSAP